MKGRTAIGDRLEGQQRAHDRHFTKGKKIHSKHKKIGDKLPRKLPKLISILIITVFCSFFSFLALTCSIILVKSVVNFSMVPTRKRQQQKRLLGQLSESDTDFLFGQNSHENQPGDKANALDQNGTLNNANDSIQVNN